MRFENDIKQEAYEILLNFEDYDKVTFAWVSCGQKKNHRK